MGLVRDICQVFMYLYSALNPQKFCALNVVTRSENNVPFLLGTAITSFLWPLTASLLDPPKPIASILCIIGFEAFEAQFMSTPNTCSCQQSAKSVELEILEA